MDEDNSRRERARAPRESEELLHGGNKRGGRGLARAMGPLGGLKLIEIDGFYHFQ